MWKSKSHFERMWRMLYVLACLHACLPHTLHFYMFAFGGKSISRASGAQDGHFYPPPPRYSTLSLPGPCHASPWLQMSLSQQPRGAVLHQMRETNRCWVFLAGQLGDRGTQMSPQYHSSRHGQWFTWRRDIICCWWPEENLVCVSGGNTSTKLWHWQYHWSLLSMSECVFACVLIKHIVKK